MKWSSELGFAFLSLALVGFGYLVRQNIDHTVGGWMMISGLLLVIAYRIASFLGGMLRGK